MKPLLAILSLLAVFVTGCQNSWYSAQREAIKADYAAGRLSPAEYYQAVAMYDKLDADRQAAAFSNFNQLQQVQAQQDYVREQERSNRNREQAATMDRMRSRFAPKKTYEIQTQYGMPTGYQLEEK
jgi:hypothetical protein